MPIAVQVDHEKRRIVAQASGALGVRDLFSYQAGIASRPELAGYDEIFDATLVNDIRDVHADGLKELAHLAASSDSASHPSKFVIVAPQDVYYGLGRMYESLRECAPHSARELATFRTRGEAERWLDAKEE